MLHSTRVLPVEQAKVSKTQAAELIHIPPQAAIASTSIILSTCSNILQYMTQIIRPLIGIRNSSVIPSSSESIKEAAVNSQPGTPTSKTLQSEQSTVISIASKTTPQKPKASEIKNIEDEEELSVFYFSSDYKNILSPKSHIYFMKYLIDLFYTCVLDTFPFLFFQDEEKSEHYQSVKKIFLKVRRLVHWFSEIPLLDGEKVINKDISSEKRDKYLKNFKSYSTQLSACLKHLDKVIDKIINGKKQHSNMPIFFARMLLLFLKYHTKVKLYGDRYTEITSYLMPNFEQQFTTPFLSWVSFSEEKVTYYFKQSNFFSNSYVNILKIIIEIMRSTAEVESFYRKIDLPNFGSTAKEDDWDSNKFSDYIVEAETSLKSAQMNWVTTQSSVFFNKQTKDRSLIEFLLSESKTRHHCLRLMAHTGYIFRHHYDAHRCFTLNKLLSLSDDLLDNNLLNDDYDSLCESENNESSFAFSEDSFCEENQSATKVHFPFISPRKEHITPAGTAWPQPT